MRDAVLCVVASGPNELGQFAISTIVYGSSGRRNGERNAAQRSDKNGAKCVFDFGADDAVASVGITVYHS